MLIIIFLIIKSNLHFKVIFNICYLQKRQTSKIITSLPSEFARVDGSRKDFYLYNGPISSRVDYSGKSYIEKRPLSPRVLHRHQFGLRRQTRSVFWIALVPHLCLMSRVPIVIQHFELQDQGRPSRVLEVPPPSATF